MAGVLHCWKSKSKVVLKFYSILEMLKEDTDWVLSVKSDKIKYGLVFNLGCLGYPAPSPRPSYPAISPKPQAPSPIKVSTSSTFS